MLDPAAYLRVSEAPGLLVDVFLREGAGGDEDGFVEGEDLGLVGEAAGVASSLQDLGGRVDGRLAHGCYLW